MSQSEVDHYIHELLGTIAQQQGIQFQSIQDANDHLEKHTKEFHQRSQQNNVMLNEGLRIFSEKCTGFVADTSKKLLAHLDSSKDLTSLIESEIRANEQAFKLFSDAANSFYDCGDDYNEQCVLIVFLMLFPSHSQPYVCYATFIWRKEGIFAAESLYTKLVNFTQDPSLDYFAADCFLKAGNSTRAKELVQRALADLKNMPQENHDLQQRLLQLAV